MVVDRHIVLRVRGMLEAIGRIRTIIGDRDVSEFGLDGERRWAVERGFEIISEASRAIPRPVKAEHPDVPWRDIATIGNHLRHRYWEVDATILWRTARLDFPVLEKAPVEILAGHGGAEDAGD